MYSTAYVQDEFLSQLAEGTKKLRHASMGFIGGFALAVVARTFLTAALRETREESAHPDEWSPSKPGHDWPDGMEGQLLALERYVEADIEMKRSYIQMAHMLTSLLPSFGFSAWVLGVPRILNRWFDERMDSLLGLMAVRRERIHSVADGLTANELKRRLG